MVKKSTKKPFVPTWPVVVPEIHYPEPSTPFGEWFAYLESLTAKSQRAENGGHMIPLPIQQMVAAGFWLVLLAIGKKLSITMATQNTVVSVAQRVNRLINGGITVSYSSPSAGAQHFLLSMNTLMQRAMNAGVRPGMSLSMKAWEALMRGHDSLIRKEIGAQQAPPHGTFDSLWQKPVALYFSRLITQLADTCRRGKKEIISFLHADNYANEIWFTDPKRAADLLYMLFYFDIEPSHMVEDEMGWHIPSFFHTVSTNESDDDLGTLSGNVWYLSRLWPLMRDFREKLRTAVTLLPYRLHDVKKEPKGETLRLRLSNINTVDDQWVKTQILLEAANVPDTHGYISTIESVKAIKKFLKLPMEELEDRVIVRMKLRGAKWTGRDEDTVRSLIKSAIAHLKPMLRLELLQKIELQEIYHKEVLANPDELWYNDSGAFNPKNPSTPRKPRAKKKPKTS